MKIDKILRGDLPSGMQRLACLPNRTLATKKVVAALDEIPSGRARTRSLYSSEHVVVMAADAIRLGLRVAGYGYCLCPAKGGN